MGETSDEKSANTSQRRAFLTGAIAGSAAGLVGAAAITARGNVEESGPAVHTRKRVEWRLASSFPSSLDTIYGAGEVLSERVLAMTEGAFHIRVYQAGELVPGLQVMDAVQKGSAEIGQTASYYYIGKNPALAFDTCLPFGFTPRQQNAWLHEGGGLEFVQELYADFGIVSFPAGNTGVQMGGWFREPIATAQDLKGLKMRIPGLGGKVMDRLGVSVQVLAGGDIYQALERGAIDATEWVGPYDDRKLGFHEVAKNYYYPGWWEPGPSLSFLVNRGAWDALPATYQAILRAAGREAAATMQERYDAKNPVALKELIAEGVQLRPFSDEILRASREAATELIEEEAAADATYARIHEQWKRYRGSSFDWFATAELAYARFAWA
jgi:TRAP-type mannitol/chloroaromatic compound transport system substrate-binding protein